VCLPRWGAGREDNADDIGIWFALDSGANTVVGNKNVVVDDGDYDCDGDTFSDPNIIAGRGAVLHGVNLGDIVSEGASSHSDFK
jgi:hypothetical protein